MSTGLNVGSLTADLGLKADAFFGVVGKAKAAFGTIGDSAEKAGRGVGNLEVAMTELGGTLRNVGGLLSKTALGFSALGAGALAAGAHFVELASKAEETGNVMQQVFGKKGAVEMEAWAESTGNAIGRSTQQMREFSSTAMAMLGPMIENEKVAGGMSKAVATLAVDLGSLWNIADEDAFTKIRAGLAGESEPLRQLGVNLLEANLNQMLFKEGINKTMQELTESEKVLVRWNAILRQTKSAQGDAERTQDSYANTLKAVKAEASELGEAFGRELLPVAQDFLRLGRQFLTELGGGQMTDGFKTIGNAVKAVADEMLLLGDVFAEVMGVIIQATTRAGSNPFAGFQDSIKRLRASLAGDPIPGAARPVALPTVDPMAGATHQQRLWGKAAHSSAMSALSDIIAGGSLSEQLAGLGAEGGRKKKKGRGAGKSVDMWESGEFSGEFQQASMIMTAQAVADAVASTPSWDNVDEFSGQFQEAANIFTSTAVSAKVQQEEGRALAIAIEEDLAAKRLAIIEKNEKDAADLFKKTLLGQQGGSWTELAMSMLSGDSRSGMAKGALSPLNGILGSDMIAGLATDFKNLIPVDLGKDAMSMLSGAAGLAGDALGMFGSALGSAVGVVGDAVKAIHEAFTQVAEHTIGRMGKDIFKEDRMQSSMGAFGAASGAIVGVASAFIGIVFGAIIGAVAGVVGSGMAAWDLSTKTKSFDKFQNSMTVAMDNVVAQLEPFWQSMMPFAGLFGMTTEVVGDFLMMLLPGPAILNNLWYGMRQVALGALTTAGAIQTMGITTLEIMKSLIANAPGPKDWETWNKLNDEKERLSGDRQTTEQATRNLLESDPTSAAGYGNANADQFGRDGGLGAGASESNMPSGYKRRADELAFLLQDPSGGVGTGAPEAEAEQRTADASEETNELLRSLIEAIRGNIAPGPQAARSRAMKGVSMAQQTLATHGTYRDLSPYSGRG